MAEEKDWLVLKRVSGGSPEIVSVVRAIPSADIRGRFPVRMEVAWGYEALPNGLPTEKELVRGRTIYAELDRIVGGNGVHAMTKTGDGGRTMYYYITNIEPLREALLRYFDSQPPLSVKVSTLPDPHWSALQCVLDGVRQ